MQDNILVFPEPPPGDTAQFAMPALPVSLTSLIAPPAYAPGYVPPGQVYRAPAVYEGYRSAYPARPAYIDRPEYSYTYAEELPPRPPAPVPYGGVARCPFDPVYGRPRYCD